MADLFSRQKRSAVMSALRSQGNAATAPRPPPAVRSTNSGSKPSNRSSAFIKEGLGFRRFSPRGLAKVTLEGELVWLAYNCQRLPRLGAALRRA